MSENTPQPQNRSDDSNANSKAMKIGKPKQVSYHEEQRAMNIARNKQILTELGLDGGVKNFVGKSSKPGKEPPIEYYTQLSG